MRVLVDTSIWSLALRRQKVASPESEELTRLVEESLVSIIGPIRQEILSGISNPKQFDLLKAQLEPFDDLILTRHHFETAAEFSNLCRKHGVLGSHTDFLICAVSRLYKTSIYTADKDFFHYQKHLPIVLHVQQ